MRHPTNRLIWLNFLHLFLVSLVPFATQWAARSRLAAPPVVVWALVFFCVDVAYLAFERAVMAQADTGQVPERTRRQARLRSLVTVAIFATASIAAFASPLLGLGLICLALSLFVRPEARPVGDWPRRSSPSMSALFRFPAALGRDPDVAACSPRRATTSSHMVQPWFERLRGLGADVRELLHDGHPTACAGDAAFAYVDAFAAHANIGFYQGAALPDPAGLLEGAGKRMRHVKLRWGQPVDEAALAELIAAAYRDMTERLRAEA